MLVGGEGLYHRAGMARGLLGDGFGGLLNASCSSGVAARTCRGRGRWIVPPIARSASQPPYHTSAERRADPANGSVLRQLRVPKLREPRPQCGEAP
jgi:hypothetical protein